MLFTKEKVTRTIKVQPKSFFKMAKLYGLDMAVTVAKSLSTDFNQSPKT